MEVLSISCSEFEYAFFMKLKSALGAKTNRAVFWAGMLALKRNRRLQKKIKEQLTILERKVKAEAQREITRFELSRLTMLVNQEKILKRLQRQGFDGKKLRKVKKLFNAELRAMGLTRARHDRAHVLTIRKGEKDESK